jgi:short-subunit dehydrogenase
MDFLRKFKIIRYPNRLIYLTGLVTVSSYLYKHWGYLYRQKDINAIKENYGNGWVVITGPTSGIGEEFAERFSGLGYNLILISRDPSKLENVSRELEQKYKITAKTIKFDFLDCSNLEKVEELRSNIDAAINNEKVSVLVNNIGVHYEHHNKFTELDQSKLIGYVSANILSQLTMYNLLLKRLRQQKSRSLIIDVSSQIAEIDIVPNDIVYQSTKTFNLRFSKLMRRHIYTENLVENVADNVDVAVFRPGMTYSNLTPSHHDRVPYIDTAKNVVDGALVDIANGYFETNGSTKHKVLSFAMSLLPDYLKLNFIGKNIYKMGLAKKGN